MKIYLFSFSICFLAIVGLGGLTGCIHSTSPVAIAVLSIPQPEKLPSMELPGEIRLRVRMAFDYLKGRRLVRVKDGVIYPAENIKLASPLDDSMYEAMSKILNIMSKGRVWSNPAVKTGYSVFCYFTRLAEYDGKLELEAEVLVSDRDEKKWNFRLEKSFSVLDNDSDEALLKAYNDAAAWSAEQIAGYLVKNCQVAP